jgi:hypothetical protein
MSFSLYIWAPFRAAATMMKWVGGGEWVVAGVVRVAEVGLYV